MNENVYKWIAVAETAFMIGVAFGAVVSGTTNVYPSAVITDGTWNTVGLFGSIVNGTISDLHVADGITQHSLSEDEGSPLRTKLTIAYLFYNWDRDWTANVSWVCSDLISGSVDYEQVFFVSDGMGGEFGPTDLCGATRTIQVYGPLSWNTDAPDKMTVALMFQIVLTSAFGSVDLYMDMIVGILDITINPGSVPGPMLWFFAIVFVIAAPAMILILIAWRKRGR